MNFLLKRKKIFDEYRAENPSDIIGMNSFVAQFYVFYGEKYLGWDCFDKNRVKVGKSGDADLVLNDKDIADIQAEFVIKGDRIIVSDKGNQGALLVNDQKVSNCIIGSLDFVKIGKYTIKIKLKKLNAQGLESDKTPVGTEPLSETVEHAPLESPSKQSDVKTQNVKRTQNVENVSKTESKQKVEKKSVDISTEHVTSEIILSENPSLSDELNSILDDDESDYVDIDDIVNEINEDISEDNKDIAYSFEPDHSENEPHELSSQGRDEKQTDMETSVVHKNEPETMLWSDFVEEGPKQAKVKREQTVSKVAKKKDQKLINYDSLDETLKPFRSDGSLDETLKPVQNEELPFGFSKSPHEEKTDVKEDTLIHDENSFPSSFFTPVFDAEDEEEDADDFPANFSLREKLTGNNRNAGRAFTGDQVLEILKFRGDNVIEINQVYANENLSIIDEGKTFCTINNSDKNGININYSETLLGKINVHNDSELKTEKKNSLKGVFTRQNTYQSIIPEKGETLISDGYYDFVIRNTFITSSPVIVENPEEMLPVHKRVAESSTFRYGLSAFAFHIFLLLILPLTITFTDDPEQIVPETRFAIVQTENIHKPEKPKPKPKPVIPAPKVKKPEKKIVKVKKRKKSNPVASLRKKKVSKKIAKAPKAGGGHKGNLVNRDVNKVGLLGTLGLKKGIGIKPAEALASVTNMDAITSTHGREARIKVGGLVGNLGDSRIAIPTGGVINNKGAANVLRSAGIGGKGSVAALQTGETGNRAVAGAVAAPLAKKAKFKGGGISRDAVAKVINEHIDEINYCYETALISDPTLMGKVVFEWKILMSGKVGEVKIKSSTVRSNEIHSCIKSAIRTWTFPKPKGAAVVVSYPFVFDVSGF